MLHYELYPHTQSYHIIDYEQATEIDYCKLEKAIHFALDTQFSLLKSSG